MKIELILQINILKNFWNYLELRYNLRNSTSVYDIKHDYLKWVGCNAINIVHVLETERIIDEYDSDYDNDAHNRNFSDNDYHNSILREDDIDYNQQHQRGLYGQPANKRQRLRR